MNAPVEAVENPFANAPVVARPGASEVTVASAQAREIAEVQASMIMARRFPRNQVEVMDQILQSCTRPTLAEGALYEYSRGGSDIRGPSIRLAEMIAQCWGHLDWGWRVLEERLGASKIQAFAWDMQTGARAQRVFDVPHERMSKGRKQILVDPRDIYELLANNASRRLRACILSVVPGDVVEAAVKQCEATLNLKVQVTPERLQNLVAQFAELGVTKAQIEKRVQRRVEAITPGLLVNLGKIFTSLRDGMSKPGDWFPTEETQPAGQDDAGEAGGPAAGVGPSQKLRTRLEARRQAGGRGAEQPPASHIEPVAQPLASDAYADIVAFCKSALTEEDLDKVRAIALQLSDEEEVKSAQEHINHAAARIRIQ